MDNRQLYTPLLSCNVPALIRFISCACSGQSPFGTHSTNSTINQIAKPPSLTGNATLVTYNTNPGGGLSPVPIMDPEFLPENPKLFRVFHRGRKFMKAIRVDYFCMNGESWAGNYDSRITVLNDKYEGFKRILNMFCLFYWVNFVAMQTLKAT